MPRWRRVLCCACTTDPQLLEVTFDQEAVSAADSRIAAADSRAVAADALAVAADERAVKAEARAAAAEARASSAERQLREERVRAYEGERDDEDGEDGEGGEDGADNMDNTDGAAEGVHEPLSPREIEEGDSLGVDTVGDERGASSRSSRTPPRRGALPRVRQDSVSHNSLADVRSSIGRFEEMYGAGGSRNSKGGSPEKTKELLLKEQAIAAQAAELEKTKAALELEAERADAAEAALAALEQEAELLRLRVAELQDQPPPSPPPQPGHDPKVAHV